MQNASTCHLGEKWNSDIKRKLWVCRIGQSNAFTSLNVTEPHPEHSLLAETSICHHIHSTTNQKSQIIQSDYILFITLFKLLSQCTYCLYSALFFIISYLFIYFWSLISFYICLNYFEPSIWCRYSIICLVYCLLIALSMFSNKACCHFMRCNENTDRVVQCFLLRSPLIFFNGSSFILNDFVTVS